MKKIQRFIIALFGTICLLYGAGGILVGFISTGNTMETKEIVYWLISLYIFLYVIGVICFAYVHENKNYKYTIPLGVLFPILIASIYLGFIQLIDYMHEPFGKDSAIYSLFPSIVVGLLLIKIINRALPKSA